jgi:flagellum-specific peptidoglycan hydrolase FlgJ
MTDQPRTEQPALARNWLRQALTGADPQYAAKLLALIQSDDLTQYDGTPT